MPSNLGFRIVCDYHDWLPAAVVRVQRVALTIDTNHAGYSVPRSSQKSEVVKCLSINARAFRSDCESGSIDQIKDCSGQLYCSIDNCIFWKNYREMPSPISLGGCTETFPMEFHLDIVQNLAFI